MTLFNSGAKGCLCATNYWWRIIISPPIRLYHAEGFLLFSSFHLSWFVTPLARLAPCIGVLAFLIHAAYLSRSVFFHTLTNAPTLWPQKLLEQWEGLPDKPFRQNLRGWLESFNSNKAGRKACLLLVIPHLLDKASQGSSAALNWCTYPYLYRSSLWLGERGNLTGLAAIQALMPICLSSFTAELAFSGAIFQAMRDMVFSLSLPLLMQLCRVNIAGSQYMC